VQIPALPEFFPKFARRTLTAFRDLLIVFIRAGPIDFFYLCRPNTKHMKKHLLALAFASVFFGGNAQVLFYEDFDGIAGPTAGGAGTYTFPTGWLLRNVDNRTPAASVSYVNEAWERREDFANNVTDSCAFSTSWYSPAGAADDWMWTPAIGSITANTVLSWNAVAYDPSYADGYEVRIMTQSSTPGGPTGGTGTIGNQVSNSTQLFSVAAENTTWTARSVSLSAYAGETVWIAFRNNSNDKFVLLIDDIKVETLINYDAQVLSAVSSEYTQIPLNQSPVFPLSATIRNNGLSTVTNVVLTANIYDQSNALVHTSTAPVLASLAAGTNSTQTVSVAFTPAVAGTYRFEYAVSIAETDQDASNDMLLADSVVVTDSVYARDIGAMIANVGIGAGSGGFLGSQYIITDTAKLSSISIYLNGQPAGSKVGVQLSNFTNGAPGATVFYLDTDSLLATQTGWYTFMLNSGPMTLLPDTYLVSAVEVDSTITLGQTTNKFLNNRYWVNWPGSPFGGWAAIENFGGSFTKAFMIRANLQDRCYAKQQVNAFAVNGSVCPNGTDTLVASGSSNYMWSSGSTNDTLIVSPAVQTTYTLVAADTSMCYDTAMVTVNIYSLPAVGAAASQDTICDGDAVMLTGSGADTYTWTGGVTNGVSFTPTVTLTYTVTGVDTNGCADTASAEIVVNACLGLNEISSGLLISAYPNPCRGTFTLETKDAVLITVYTIAGEEVMNAKFNGGKHTIDLSRQAQGVYFLKAVRPSGDNETIKIFSE
jgi:hypothetical protein